MNTDNNKKNKSIDDVAALERQRIYNNSTFFKKKNEEAIEFLKKHPIPKEFLKR